MSGWELIALGAGFVVVVAWLVWARACDRTALPPSDRALCRRYATAVVRRCEARGKGIPDADAEQEFRDAAAALLKCVRQSRPTTQPAEAE